ncbi:MAG: potassium transporter TrkG [bacterium]
MIPKPTLQDIKTIGYYSGRLIVGYGLLMIIPIAVSFLMNEYNEGINFFISFLCCMIIGYILLLICPVPTDLSWIEGMVIASVSWILTMFLGAIPLFMSGHFISYTDACFDAMSGLATVGLSLIQDLDHISYTVNMWRFTITFIGGQGMILIALTLLIRTSGVYGMYVGEGREDRILPNIVQTARIIWAISLSYFCLGTLVLWFAYVNIGLPKLEAFWHSMWLYISSWATCGFAPQSMSLLYYHSLTIEIITAVVIILGVMNFSIHYALFTGNRKEIYKNIEIISFISIFLIVFFIVINGLVQQQVYSNFTTFFRKALYLVISALGTAGHSTIYPQQFLTDWGPLAMIGLIIAMGIGGNSGSTSGAIKSLRIGILFKGMLQDIKSLSLPKSAVVKEKFHHIKDIVLEDKIVRSTMFIIFCFLFSYGLGTFVGVIYDYPLLDALFDSVSTGSGTGLSCGIVSPQMPFLLKITYIFEMWAGRLEFMSIFALISFVISTTQLWSSKKRVIR